MEPSILKERLEGHSNDKRYFTIKIAIAKEFETLHKQNFMVINYASDRKIPKISPGAYIFQRPLLRGLFLEGLMLGGKFALQNRLG